MFEWKLKHINGVENLKDMACIHDDKVNKIDQLNLLHDIIILLNALKYYIAITLLFYMDLWIPDMVERSLRTFESYWTVDVVLWL